MINSKLTWVKEEDNLINNLKDKEMKTKDLNNQKYAKNLTLHKDAHLAKTANFFINQLKITN